MIKRTTLAAALFCSLLHGFGAAAQTGPAAKAIGAAEQDAGASVPSERKRFEVGVHLSILRYNDYGDYGTEPGVGGRFTYNLNDNLAVEVEANFYPRAHESDPTVSGRKMLALFGIKAGVRKGRLGFFGKARPGFLHLSRGLELACLDGDCSIPTTNFAFDLGGVTEYSLSPRTLLRFDLGDTIIRSGIIGGYNVTHNLQLNAGVGFRF